MQAEHTTEVISQLRDAVQLGQIPARQQALGAQILDHLSGAIRVVVFGRAGSGKSSLIDMCLGQELLTKLPSLDVVELRHGAVDRITLEWADGKTKIIEGNTLPSSETAGAVRAVIERPLPALRSQTFFEIAMPDDPQRQAALLQQGLAAGQVFIWCSAHFDTHEQAIWDQVPDATKDNSFLALTMADQHLMKGALSAHLARLEEVASEGFLGMYPIATLHALKARASAAPQPEIWGASGGSALLEAVQTQINRGRSADLDQAAMLLAQIAQTPTTISQPARRSGGQPQASTTTPGSASAAALGAVQSEQAQTLSALQRHLQSCAQDMLAGIESGQIPDAQSVLERCAAGLRDLIVLLEADLGQGAVISEILEDARDGEEMLLLLQVEHSPTAAEDAVFLLLQLKKEIGGRALA